MLLGVLVLVDGVRPVLGFNASKPGVVEIGSLRNEWVEALWWARLNSSA